jgi:O-antigen/teichoic acid export membrane protein
VQFASLTIVLAFLIALGIAIAFAFTIAAPIIAIPIFIVLFVGFLIWRGADRTKPRRRRPVRAGEGVPSTAEASSNPAEDSGASDVPRAGGNRQRTTA